MFIFRGPFQDHQAKVTAARSEHGIYRFNLYGANDDAAGQLLIIPADYFKKMNNNEVIIIFSCYLQKKIDVMQPVFQILNRLKQA
jgi:hypothetical protein